MISRLVLMVLWALSAISQGAVEIPPGPRPSVPVFDPSGVLKPYALQEIARPLEALYKSEGVDVIVVVLPKLDGEPPAQVAHRFAAAWCKDALRCVVLAVPNDPESPWIFPSGTLLRRIDPEELASAVVAAQRRAAAETLEAGKIKTAANEAADLLRFWLTNSVNRTETLLTESVRRRIESETRRRHWKIAAITTAAAVVPLLAGIFLLMNYFRRRGPVYFPVQLQQPRLGAPHAGGNHAVADLGKFQP